MALNILIVKKGCPYDNAPMEAFHSILKKEEVYLKNYSNLDSVTIKVKTKLKVLENNADSKKGDIYYWTFTQSDNKKNIYLKLSTKKDEATTIDDTKKDKSEDEKIKKEYAILCAIGAILLLLIVVVLITKVSSRKYK